MTVEARIIGHGSDAQRMHKRLGCAARALGIDIQVNWLADNLAAAEMGARQGPLVVVNGAVLADGLLSVEELQQKLKALLRTG